MALPTRVPAPCRVALVHPHDDLDDRPLLVPLEPIGGAGFRFGGPLPCRHRVGGQRYVVQPRPSGRAPIDS